MDKDNMLFVPKRKKYSYFRTVDVIFLLFITCVVTLNMSYIISLVTEEKNNSSEENYSDELNKFINEYQRIVDNYYGDLDENKLIDAAINGLIDALPDDYSQTLDSSESNNYDTKLKGVYDGLGVEIVNDTDKNIFIYNIIEDSPAEEANLEVGDKLLMVNDFDLVGKTTTEFVNYVKSSNAEKFNLVLDRNGERITTTVSKRQIILKSVSSEIIEKNDKKIGYLEVSIFAANTYSQFKENLNSLEKGNIDSLIIDVRGNGGGYLSAVTDMLSLFIDKSEVIYQTVQNDITTKIYSKQSGSRAYNIVVLIDGSSASASEIMAAALKEQCGAILVGKKTYGKGTVQELITLDDGVQYKYTTKKWLTPKGNWIDGKGLEPDYEVSLDETYIKDPSQANDAQLQKALEVLTSNN